MRTCWGDGLAFLEFLRCLFCCLPELLVAVAGAVGADDGACGGAAEADNEGPTVGAVLTTGCCWSQFNSVIINTGLETS